MDRRPFGHLLDILNSMVETIEMQEGDNKHRGGVATIPVGTFDGVSGFQIVDESDRNMAVGKSATLPVRERTVLFLTCLLEAERVRRGTRSGRRALSTLAQAVWVLGWFLDGTRMTQLAVDNGIGMSTG